jgi:hypothetical protein
MKQLFLACVFGLLSFNASALPGSWTPYQPIATIIIENGIALILTQGGVPAAFIPPACNQIYNQAVLSTEHGKAVYTLALAAYLANKPVSLALGCNGSRPSIDLIRL